MTEWIITSSVLILIVIALRFLLRGKISLLLQYALWGLVLIRLLVPVSLFASPLSILGLLPEQKPAEPVSSETRIEAPASADEGEVLYIIEDPSDAELPAVDTAPIKANTEKKTFSLSDLNFTQIWIFGAALTAVALFASNMTFNAQLHRTRESIKVCETPLRTYYSPVVITPCMFGLFKPVIYLTASVLSDEKALSHVLAHETTHWRHKDHIWAFFRCVALSLHWYNPLVWIAAFLSLRDAELACDEDTIKKLGEEERFGYGKTLIALTCRKPMAGILSTATTMTGSKSSIKERIMLIAKKPKMLKITAAVLAVLILIVLMLTFTKPKENSMLNPVVFDSMPETIYGDCMEKDGKYYITDKSGNIIDGPYDGVEVVLSDPELESDSFYVFSDKNGGRTRHAVVFDENDRASWEEVEDVRYTLYQINMKRVNSVPFTSYSSFNEMLSALAGEAVLDYYFDREINEYTINCEETSSEELVRLAGDYGYLRTIHRQTTDEAYFGILDLYGNTVADPIYSYIEFPMADRFLVREGGSANQGPECGRSFLLDESGEKLGGEYNEITFLSLSDGRMIGIAHSFGKDSEVQLLDDYGYFVTEGYWFIDKNGTPISERFEVIEPRSEDFYQANGKNHFSASGTIDVTDLDGNTEQICPSDYSFAVPNVKTVVSIEPWDRKLNDSELKEAQEALKGMVLNSDGTVSLSEISPFLSHYYPSVNQIDLSAFLEYCPDSGTLESGKDDEEFAAVNAKCHRFPEDATLSKVPVPVHRYTASDINALLLKYAGLGIEDVKNDPRNQASSTDICYLEEYDSYYNFFSDSVDRSFQCDAGDTNGRKVRLFQYDKNHTESGEGVTILSLQKYEGKYYFLSYMHYDAYVEKGSEKAQELYFWQSEYGKDILEWCEEPNLYTKVLNKDFVLYYCEGTVYVKTEKGIIDEVIDQVNIDPELIRFDGKKLYVPFESGNWRYGPGNFPYDFVYNIDNKTSSKAMWSLSTTSMQHTVMGNSSVNAKTKRVDVSDNAASIYFDINVEEQTGEADSYFPKMDYFFNEHDRLATLYIYGISDNEKKIKAIEKIEGIDKLQISVSDEKENFSGTKISFSISSEFDLFCEVFADYETSPDDHLKIWTAKKEKIQKPDAFDLPPLYYQTVLHSTRLFHDVDFETVGGDTLLLKMKKFSFGMDKGSLGALNEPVKTLEFFGDGLKYSFKLYENGFIPSGSGFAAQTLEEAYGFTENPEEWKQILETLNAAYQDFAPDYGASWLGLVNPDRVTDLSIALNGTKATYAQNDRTDEITSIVQKLRGILVEDNPSSSAEKPVSVPGTLSLTLDFYTGIQYEITIHNGELKIYASDVGKTLTYKIKDNDPYDALLPYVSGTQEVNYVTG